MGEELFDCVELLVSGDFWKEEKGFSSEWSNYGVEWHLLRLELADGKSKTQSLKILITS
jgi:hypothetical protein